MDIFHETVKALVVVEEVKVLIGVGLAIVAGVAVWCYLEIEKLRGK